MKNTVLTELEILGLAARRLSITNDNPAVEVTFTEPDYNTSSFIKAGVPTVVMVAGNANHPGGKPELPGSQEEGLCHDSSMLFFVPGSPKDPGHGYGQAMEIGEIQGHEVMPCMATNLCLNGYSYRTVSDVSDALPVCVYDHRTEEFDKTRMFTPVYVASPDFRTKFRDQTANDFGIENRAWVNGTDGKDSFEGRSAYVYFMALQVRMTIAHALEVYKKYPLDQKKSLLLTALGGLAFQNNPKLVAAIYRVVLDEYAEQLREHHVKVTMVWPPSEFKKHYNASQQELEETLMHANPIAGGKDFEHALAYQKPSSMLWDWMIKNTWRPLKESKPQARMNRYLKMEHNNDMTPVCLAYRKFLDSKQASTLARQGALLALIACSAVALFFTAGLAIAIPMITCGVLYAGYMTVTAYQATKRELNSLTSQKHGAHVRIVGSRALKGTTAVAQQPSKTSAADQCSSIALALRVL